MFEVALNPGFVPIVAALLVLAAPTALRAPTMIAAAVGALWLVLFREFGSQFSVAQMGISFVPLNLDALNRIFGIGMLIALVLIAINSNARRSRFEDAAILALAGGAVSALFVGDFISLTAGLSFAGLAAAWLVSCSPLEGAAHSGVRLLIWHSIEGLLLLVGVAFHLAGGAASAVYAQLDAHTIAGGFIFAALMIQVGAPFAHVWLKDIVSHASAAGGAALSVFTTMTGVYAIARLFPAEPMLVPIGMAMTVIGCIFAAGEDDMRRAAAYGLAAQAGVCVALIGIGSPLALAAAQGHAFTAIFAFLLLQMALGAVLHRMGEVRASRFEGLVQAMPITATLMTIGGLAVAGMPGLAPYVSLSVAYEATGEWETRWVWTLIAASSAVLFVSLALRPTLAAHLAPIKQMRINEAPFTMLLGAALAAFFCFSVGFAPSWLYGLMPAELVFEPFELERFAPQVELLCGAGVIYLALRAVRLAPKERPVRILDIDALYRGPVAGAGRWVGVVMLRLYGTWQAAFDRIADRSSSGLTTLTRMFDRPYAGAMASAAQLAAIAVVIAIILIARQ